MIKSVIYRLLTGLKSSIKYLPNNNIDRQDFPQIFYIYNNETHKIIFIGVIDGYKEINGKNYKNVNYLLRRPNTFGAGKIAVYHILEKLNIEYNGICLASLLSSRGFYDKLGFINYGGTLYLDKNKIETLRTESIEKTEFVSLFDKIY